MLKAVARLSFTTLAINLWASVAFAATGDIAKLSFVDGFIHPQRGLDHVLAMVAVGLWSGQFGGRTIWTAPFGFVSLMAVGGALGMLGTWFPLVEGGIVTSVLIFGVLVMMGTKPPIWLGLAAVNAFALFHGYAHGAEMDERASGLLYAAGFVLATGLLHLLGIGVAKGMKHLHLERAVQVAGAGIVIGGFILALR